VTTWRQEQKKVKEDNPSTTVKRTKVVAKPKRNETKAKEQNTVRMRIRRGQCVCVSVLLLPVCLQFHALNTAARMAGGVCVDACMLAAHTAHARKRRDSVR